MKKYKAIVFDLDGTLAESKQRVTKDMAELLAKLSYSHIIAIISGGDWSQYLKQLISDLIVCDINTSNIIYGPTCATKMYVYDKTKYQNSEWLPLYSLNLSFEDKSKIKNAFISALAITGLKPEKTWGPQLEDRGTQITFSALGQEAPLSAKTKWDPDFTKRKLLKVELDRLLPDHSIRLGGTTSIDITAAGVDKAYGIKKISEHTKILIADMLYVGDAIFPDGNDYPVISTGCDYICVNSVEQTKEIIANLINLD